MLLATPPRAASLFALPEDLAFGWAAHPAPEPMPFRGWSPAPDLAPAIPSTLAVTPPPEPPAIALPPHTAPATSPITPPQDMPTAVPPPVTEAGDQGPMLAPPIWPIASAIPPPSVMFGPAPIPPPGWSEPPASTVFMPDIPPPLDPLPPHPVQSGALLLPPDLTPPGADPATLLAALWTAHPPPEWNEALPTAPPLAWQML